MAVSQRGLRSAHIVTAIAASCLWASAAQAKELQRWELKERLGHHWQNELVFFPVTVPEATPGNEAKFSVTDNAGMALPFQFWRQPDPSGKEIPAVGLLIDLAPYASRSFVLTDEPHMDLAPPNLEVHWYRASYVLRAGRTGVYIRRHGRLEKDTLFQDLPAPIQSVYGAYHYDITEDATTQHRVMTQRSLGEGRLVGKLPVQEYAAEIEARGPLFAQARVRYQFGPRKFYQVRVRVVSGEDVVLVEEDFALSEQELKETTFVTPPDLAPEIGTPSPLTDWLVNKGMGWIDVVADMEKYPCFRFNFFGNWRPDRVRGYALGGQTIFERKNLTDAAEDWRLGLVLTPFQARGRRVCMAGFDRKEGGKNYLGVFHRYLGRWKYPNENRVPMPWLDDGVCAHFFAFEGHREWGLMMTEAGAHNDDVKGKHGRSKFAAIRKAQVKHGETPLDKVKDWVLEWDLPADTTYPRLYYTPESVARMKRDFPTLPEDVQAILKSDGPAHALLTGDEFGLKKAFDEGHARLRVPVEAFLNGGHNTIDTYTHRFQEIVRHAVPILDIGMACRSISPEERKRVPSLVMSLADIAMTGQSISPKERKRALAVVAFLAYKISDPDYWAYRGYGGGPSNPNMMGIATNALAMCAAMCPGHPKQQEWLKLCERLVCADILMSIGPEGAWLESPGYQGAGNTPVNMTVLILKNAGVVDLTKHPVFGKRLLAVSRYFANLLTPPDPRFGNKRMPMSLGDSVPYFNNMFTYLANSGREAFPTEAGNAVWCWQEMGRPSKRAALMLLNERVMDGTIKPVPISGKSVQFPGFGVMLRHGFGTKHETYMTYRQNDFGYGHYDEDQGSFSLFAKGAPLCLDWMDYSPGKAEHHNRVDYHPAINPWLVPPPDASVSHAEADYVRSHEAGLPEGAKTRTMPKDAEPEWQRQFVLVKDTKDPGDATYLVFRDQVDTGRASEWNTWVMSRKGTGKIDNNVARFEGQFDVDVTFFFYRKPGATLKTTFLRHETRSYLKKAQEQTRIQAASPSGGDYGVMLYPLRRGVDKEPTVSELKSGAVEVKWPSGRRHLIFLFPGPREVKEAGIAFNGRAGIVKFEARKKTLVPLECEELE